MKIFGDHQENTLAQINDVAERAQYTALMADGHLGYIMPVGGVAAYVDRVSVAGVGVDIGCGNYAIKTSRNVELDKSVLEFAPELADEIQYTISFGVGKENYNKDAPVDHPLFDDPRWMILPKHIREPLRDKARAQLGSVGGGNHYVDLFYDEDGYVWIGVHFGSRSFGHEIATGYMNIFKGNQWGKRGIETEALLPTWSLLGDDYWNMMELAGAYAWAGREWVAKKTLQILTGELLLDVHNNHNFAWKERHHGKDLVVVRKGATPAFPGQLGFVGGSMGDISVIIEGATTDDEEVVEEQRAALFSTIHGAGRVMSRSEARGKFVRKTGAVKVPGKVTEAMMDSWLKEKNVVRRGGNVDESPHVYRRLEEVLAAQGKTINVLHTLQPFIVVMAE